MLNRCLSAGDLNGCIVKSGALVAVLLVSLVVSLNCRAAGAANGNQALPISVSIWCTPDTPAAYRVEYKRAPDARPEVQSTECIDIRESISYIKPNSVDVEYLSQIRSWMLAVSLSDGDTSRVKTLIARNLGKAMLVGVNKMALSIAFLAVPMDGNKIYIKVNSEQDGLNLKRDLVSH